MVGFTLEGAAGCVFHDKMMKYMTGAKVEVSRSKQKSICLKYSVSVCDNQYT